MASIKNNEIIQSIVVIENKCDRNKSYMTVTQNRYDRITSIKQEKGCYKEKLVIENDS